VLLDRGPLGELAVRLLTLVALAGCPTRERFDRRVTDWYCETLLACRPAVAYGLGGCRTSLIEQQKGVSACLSTHCRFDRSAASACIAALREADCAAFEHGDWRDVCADAWVDCDADADACRGPVYTLPEPTTDSGSTDG
jgi:hypothetical protein